jgi:hypothetical protein
MVPSTSIPPRMPFAGTAPPFGFPPGPPGNLQPSPLPRNFGPGPSFEPGFSRGALPTPIGPPTRQPPPLLGPIGSPPTSLPIGGPSRRESMADLGPITRPTPRARPTTAGDAPSSGSGSPARRSPSPKGTLGSSALVADGDEVYTPATRRASGTAPVGHSWINTSPRGVIGESVMRGAGPWTSPTATQSPSFVGRPGPIGSSAGGSAGAPLWSLGVGLGVSNAATGPGAPPPGAVTSPTGPAPPPSADWHPQPPVPPFFTNHFVNASPPHAG